MNGADNLFSSFDPNFFNQYFLEEYPPPLNLEEKPESDPKADEKEGTTSIKRSRESNPELLDDSTSRTARKKARNSQSDEVYEIDDEPFSIYKTIFKSISTGVRSEIPVVAQKVTATVKVIFNGVIEDDDVAITAKFEKKKEKNGIVETKEISDRMEILEGEDPPYEEIKKGRSVVTYSFRMKEGVTSFRKHAVYHLSFVINDTVIKVLDHIVVVSKSNQVSDIQQGKTISKRIGSLVSPASWNAEYQKSKKEKPMVTVKQETTDGIDYDGIINRLIRQKKQELRRLQNLKNNPDQNTVMKALLQEYSKLT